MVGIESNKVVLKTMMVRCGEARRAERRSVALHDAHRVVAILRQLE